MYLPYYMILHERPLSILGLAAPKNIVISLKKYKQANARLVALLQPIFTYILSISLYPPVQWQ